VNAPLAETRYTAFDNLGRVTGSQQITEGTAYNPQSYVYNLSGALIEETYPSGRVVKNTLDNDGDLSQVQSRKANDSFRNYANSFNYTAAGAVSSMRLGNGRWENTTFNSRLQPTQIGLGASAASQNSLKLNFDYGTTDNNGNVKSQQITVPTIGAINGFTAIQTYTYDSLNRIKDAKEMIGTSQQWKQTFQYDRYGNRRFDTANNNTTTLQANCQVAVCNPTIDPATNKLIGYQFDSSGNTKVDANNQTFVYDAENKQVQVSNANGIVGQYFYDGDGKRVKKIIPNGETTIFVYDASGKMVAEYSTIVAQATDAKVSYLTNDHLGSPRITTDANGQVISRRDFLPFGEEIARANYGTDTVRQKFTGYEKDVETDLDFAQSRYFNSGVGRFSSPDSFTNDTRVSDPQSWNLYSYVRNNPLNMIDPFGKDGRIRWWTNPETGVVTVSLEASFAIYAAKGQKVTDEDLAKVKEELVKGIQSYLEKEFDISGKKFNVVTDVSAQVFTSESDAIRSGADNIVEVGNTEIIDNVTKESAAGMAFNVAGENFGRMVIKIAGENDGITTPTERVAAHEFAAHLLNGKHNSKNDRSLFYSDGGAGDFAPEDFERLVGPEITNPPPPFRNYQPVKGGLRPVKTESRNNSSAAAVYKWKNTVSK
jgi:RHS repeat-associated protein